MSETEECVIIGGGVAGLSAANRLADAGMSPLVIDASQYPAHRLCGEFISHECLPILHKWDIPLSNTITFCQLVKGDRKIQFRLPIDARSCSRYEFDSMLLDRAKRKGAKILTETKAVTIRRATQTSENHELILSNGQAIKTRFLMIGMGRYPNYEAIHGTVPLLYSGFKAHFEGIDLKRQIEMHFFEDGYLGLSPIDENRVNVACIVKKERVHSQPFELFMTQLQQTPSMQFFNERIRTAKMLFPQWLVGHVPEFGIRSTPDWERVFWIGDAAGSIPPLSGDGLAAGIQSGCLAADFLINSDWQEFKKAWLKMMKARFFWAKQMHGIMLSPLLSNFAFKACTQFPSLPPFFWKKTRDYT